MADLPQAMTPKMSADASSTQKGRKTQLVTNRFGSRTLLKLYLSPVNILYKQYAAMIALINDHPCLWKGL